MKDISTKQEKQPTSHSLNLNGPAPIREVCQLKTPGAVEVYSLLFQSAYMDRRFDKRKQIPWSLRRDCGGTTEWSIKGLASELHLGKTKVGKAIDVLLRNGFLRVLGFIPSGNGSPKRIFQVIRPTEIEAVKASLSVIGEPFGLTTNPQPKSLYTRSQINEMLGGDLDLDSAIELEDIDDTEFSAYEDFLDEDYDPTFNGLCEGNFTKNVTERLQKHEDENPEVYERLNRLRKSCK